MKVFRLNVKKSIPLFTAVIDKLCGNYNMSLEGDLKAVSFLGITNLVEKRKTSTHDQYDHVIFPLTVENVIVLKSLVPRIGIRRRVVHIRIQQEDNTVFASYDWFDKGSVWIDANVGNEFVEHLLQEGVIREYKSAEIADDSSKNTNITTSQNLFAKARYFLNKSMKRFSG